MHITPAQLAQYRTAGYVHLKAVYTPEEIARARQLIDADLESGEWHRAPTASDDITTDIYERIPELAAIVFNDNYVNAMRELFAPEPVIIAEPAVHRSRYFYWHKDSTFIDELGEDYHWQDDFAAAMTVMYLQPNHPTYGGGISLVPGTQRDPDFYHTIKDMSLPARALLKAKKMAGISHFDKLDKHPDLTPIPTEDGDVLVMDMRLDHKGTPAKKPAPVTKYGIMNIACSGHETARRLQRTLRNRPGKYYQEYLSREPEATPILLEYEGKTGVKFIL